MKWVKDKSWSESDKVAWRGYITFVRVEEDEEEED